eukprot:CAMPEP_0179121432 /NCGR_PEP_ID=MMETSP0796-20121207/57267_1 /TAXON_ID=73915 /ORGANISM="Pyrodinium bahamense, Strain pbaha01" /LENGTH=148 /DNA_ID=CAMNT_0020820023 /DNA_START=97 /DNA_END=539 /DNA_ORIENTATION=-
MSSRRSGSRQVRALPPLGFGKDLLNLDAFGDEGLSLKSKAEKKDRMWSRRLRQALDGRQNAELQRSTTVASLASADTAPQPWWAGFHHIRGELAKAWKADMNLRRIENRRVAQPTVRGLFRTEMLTRDAEVACNGLSVEDWRGAMRPT